MRRTTCRPALCLLVALAASIASAAELPKPPSITRLRDLHLQTVLVEGRKPAATIIAPRSGCYDALARKIAAAVQTATGTPLLIATDHSPAAALPFQGNLILLGNRSTNRVIEELYNRYYTLLDLRYPGEGGYVVRTLHNPLGNGHNLVFLGGSDLQGVQRAAQVFLEKLGKARQGDSIRLGPLVEIQLGSGIKVPTDIKDVETWEASVGYGSIGYFGWNSLSKRMALYYMTGDPVHAREFLRLAFPDAKARQEIDRDDGERIEDKDHPLSGPYHYCAHMMILYWNLIEQSPVFTDADRLRVTQAFAAQLNHWTAEGSYGGRSFQTPRAVGSRHGTWAAISVYCLARYFQTYYPDPVWQQQFDWAQRCFYPLHEHAWVSGENDNLFWSNTAIAPILTYMLLTGDRVPQTNGVLATLLRSQDVLASGRPRDWALQSAALDFLHKAAYLTGDGRWLEYRNRTGIDVEKFRIGQSFWPDKALVPRPPEDLVGRWTIQPMAKLHWQSRASGLPLDQSFLFGSYRSQVDGGGDFILVDGYNGGGRNPYHTFPILDLRIAGYTLLSGYNNQVFTRVDGLMEPKVAMDSSIRRCDVVGSTSFLVAEVPRAAFANWRRTLVTRTGRYALVIDQLTFRNDSPTADVHFEWETAQSAKQAAPGRIVFPAVREQGVRSVALSGQICACDPLETTGTRTQWTMHWTGPVKAGQCKSFFSLVSVEPGLRTPTMQCSRIGENMAALALPEPATVVLGPGDSVKAELAIAASDHLFGLAATDVGPLRSRDAVDFDWDYCGVLQVVAPRSTSLEIAVQATADVRIDGRRPAISTTGSGKELVARFDLPAGRHLVENVQPARAACDRLSEDSKRRAAEARGARQEAASVAATAAEPDVGPSSPIATLKYASAIVDIETISTAGGPMFAIAEGSRVHLVAPDGRETLLLPTDGLLRVLRFWPETGLLLAGCADEKVIAFEPATGRRRWVFVSVMDPAVYRAAKTYWFKSEPGHEGIHGLTTGTFLNGKSQAFVGSACTIEIINDRGELMHRLPRFWGKVSLFALVDGPHGTKNLLSSCKFNGVNDVGILNSETLDPKPRGFMSVPAGHTQVDGWSSMNRRRLFYEDLEGRGTRDVISEINGTWNRVCVWSVDGRPKAAANFGPGPKIPAVTIHDLDVCDLDGDGKKEIVTSTAYSMVVALDCMCNKLWAKRLPAAAVTLNCVRPRGSEKAVIVLGCNDGQLRVLDARGSLVHRALLPDPAVCAQRLARADGREVIAIGTASGASVLFKVTP